MPSPFDPFASATDLLGLLRSRQISAVELLEGYISRVEALDGRTNAVVVRDFERARAAAAAADAERAAGGDRPLLGLPLTLKESVAVRGLQSTNGFEHFTGFVPDWDAPATTRFKGAGAVIFGKTNVPPGLADWQSENRVYGRTNNPWDLGRSPGGSSGGSAAALAAGLTAAEWGSDIGGSIRMPAAFCGVYGHRPSDSAVPRTGQGQLPPRPNSATAMSVQGPLARSAEDLELLFGLAAGPDAGEDVGWTLTLPAPRATSLGGLRVAVFPAIDWLPVDAETMEALDRLASGLGKLGARVGTAAPEALADMRTHHIRYATLLNAMMSRMLPEEARQRIGQPQSSDDEFAAATRAGHILSAAAYLDLFTEREIYRESYRAFFKDWDILLAPIAITPAFEHRGLGNMNDWTIQVNGEEIPYARQMVYPGVATLSGQPATAFPVGLTSRGLPIGLQAIGPYLEDATTMRFAALVEREFGGFRAPAGF